MEKIELECLEVIFDYSGDETFVGAFAFDAGGRKIEPDDFEELPESTRVDGGVYRWRDTWNQFPDDGLLVRITCMKKTRSWCDYIRKPDEPTVLQFMRLDILLEGFDLDYPEWFSYEVTPEDDEAIRKVCGKD